MLRILLAPGTYSEISQNYRWRILEKHSNSRKLLNIVSIVYFHLHPTEIFQFNYNLVTKRLIK